MDGGKSVEGYAEGSPRTISMRDWFIANHCDNASVNQMLQAQKSCGTSNYNIISKYMRFWTELGSGTFYILVIPVLIWAGYEFEGIFLCFALSMGLYMTDCLKDYFGCPRPPTPPVRRGGQASHGLEYGWPSTHTCLAMILCEELIRFGLARDGSTANLSLYIFMSLFFVSHVSFSRIYLGLHWVADVVGGAGVYATLSLLNAAFIRDAYRYVFDRPDTWPYWFVWAAGHLMVVWHATPKDPCPCFEDSVRFIGVDVGALIGSWYRRRHFIPLVHGAKSGFLPTVLTKAFMWRYGAGIVAVVLVDVGFGAVVKKAMPTVMRFFAGSAKLGPLQLPYKILCCAVGFVLAKPLGASTQDEPSTVTLSATPQSPADASDAIAITMETEEKAAGRATVHSGVYWSMRNHTHWWEGDVQAKMVAYGAIGVTVTALGPMLFDHFEL